VSNQSYYRQFTEAQDLPTAALKFAPRDIRIFRGNTDRTDSTGGYQQGGWPRHHISPCRRGAPALILN